jgi:hypothetical protein
VIVTSRQVPDDIYQGEHRTGKYLLMGRNAKPYVDHTIFERFICHYLISHITALRNIPCYSKAEAVLVMDNCSAHITPETCRLLGKNYIEIVTFAPYTQKKFRSLISLFWCV